MSHLTEEQIVLIAAEAGARAALERIEIERQQSRKGMADRRLRNTKLLLRNYRLFKAHAENAVYEVMPDESPQTILEDLMMPGRDNTLFVESIKESAARTATIVKHMETMMQLYHAYCVTTGEEEDLRRWRVVNGLYNAPERETVAELAAREGVVERTVYKDIDAACEKIAALMFGIDGIKKK